MPGEKTQPQETNPSEETKPKEGSPGEGTSEGGSKDQPSPEDFAKQKIEEATGRKFESLEEALKTTSETYKENSRLAQNPPSQQKEEPKPSEEQPQYVSKAELEELKFLNQYPNAKDYLPQVKTLSSQYGGDFLKAFEESGLKEVFDMKSQKAQTQEEQNKSVPPTTDKLSPDDDELKQATEAAKRGDVSKLLKLKTKHLYTEQEPAG